MNWAMTETKAKEKALERYEPEIERIERKSARRKQTGESTQRAMYDYRTQVE